MKYSYVIKMMLLGLALIPYYAGAEKAINLKYEKTNEGVFKATLNATGLKKNHKYFLTLDGESTHGSNKLLAKIMGCQIETVGGDAFCDFDEVTTDTNGILRAEITEKLPKGRYKIAFLIKDPSNKWHVTLYKDPINFEVK